MKLTEDIVFHFDDCTLAYTRDPIRPDIWHAAFQRNPSTEKSYRFKYHSQTVPDNAVAEATVHWIKQMLPNQLVN